MDNDRTTYIIQDSIGLFYKVLAESDSNAWARFVTEQDMRHAVATNSGELQDYLLELGYKMMHTTSIKGVWSVSR